jgi:hypothetical protein
VHGIGNKPAPSVLKCQWDHALFGFDLGERSRLAYWVNREYYPDPAKGTCASGDLVELEEEPTGKAISIQQHLDQVPLSSEVDAVAETAAEHKTLLRLATRIEHSADDSAAARAGALAIGAKVLPLPAPVRRWLTRRLTRAFLRDAHDYFYVPARRELMLESLMERLRPGGGPFVVVAHSQGSMIV